MATPHVAGLIEDIRAAFLAPAATLAMMYARLYAWVRLIGRGPWDWLYRKLSLSFVLAVFVLFLTALMHQDRATLVALWHQHPTVYSLLYAGACALVASLFAGLNRWQLRPALWRPSEEERKLREEYARARAAKRRLFRLDGDPPPDEDDTQPR